MEEPLSACEKITQLCEQVKGLLAHDSQQALCLAQQALALAQQIEAPRRLLLQALICRGGAQRFCGDLDASFEDYSEVLAQCRDQGSELDDLHASALLGLGIVYRNRADYRQALDCYQQGLERARRSGAKRIESTLLNGLGNVHSVLGSHTEAVGYYLQALTLAREQADPQAELVMLGNLGFLFEEMGDFEQALTYYEQALVQSDRVKDRYFRVSILSNKCSSLRQLGRFEQALSAGLQAHREALESGNEMRRAPTLQVLAALYKDIGEYEQAEQRIQEAIQIYKVVGNLRHLPEALRLQGGLASLRGEHALAEAAFLAALERTQTEGDPKEEAAAHQALAEHFESRGELGKALPHFKAYHALEQRLRREQVQLVLASRLTDRENEVARKDAELQRLRNGELAELVAALERANQQKEVLLVQLSQQAIEDPLTGLYNRRYLEEYLPRELQFAQRQKQVLALALADLDNFKQINDHFSHEVGDQVLKIVSQIFRKHSRKSDVVIRYGGEELLLVMPETDSTQGRDVCERIRRAVESHPWKHFHPDLHVTLSMGLSDSRTRSPRRLLQHADKMLYVAKNAGKNQVAA
ncbi:tetratricopeptide repeat-containing diguanylate cyclase [Armatimonas rosea]|uniref:Diguanylate cyclase (GGDEF)-like protein n=1 Tax=Armatimonas rosea TaxID=685828 RepID=A0A7W9W8W2_ARMRO|nr:tetratricopeptide repeat-containing diguanylate cyclase [Armatimonas rosea]MBB6052681.1 diguanylate cyclase (GGDEF)-like protein [Armatimonas rosea]